MTFIEIEEQIKSEYGLERDANTFIEWAESCFSRVRNICSKEQFQRSNILKRIREEAWPLRVFLKNNSNAFQTVQLFNGNQNFDGIGKKNSDITYIEITCHKDGEFDLFQAKHMDMFGSAPASGVSTNDYSRALKTGEISHGDCIYSEGEVDRVLQGAIDCIRNKNKKDYKPNTILIVGVETSSFVDESAWNKFCESLSRFSEKTQFSMIFSVCLVENRCIRIK